MLMPDAGAHAATLNAIRQITAPATTRLIVEFSAPVRYRLERAGARPEIGVPPRLYLDFPETELGNSGLRSVALAQGPVLRLRAAQPVARATRLILDVPGLTDFGAFPMLDPFRLIIDVRGTPRAAPPSAGAAADRRPDPGRASPPGRQAGTLARLPRPQRPEPPLPPPDASRRFKIVIDPGHGGKDPGAIGVGNVAEKDIVLAIGLQLRDRLAASRDLDVVLTRDTDTFIALEERTARANAEQADLFISIHTNASPNPNLSGVETYYLSNTDDRATLRLAELENGLRDLTGQALRDRDASLILSDLIQSYKIEESTALAEHVQRAVVAELGARGTPADDRGVKQGPFYVLVGAGMPCVLVEVSFLTHPEEGARLADRAYQDAIAGGLLRGIRRFVENTRVVENL
jgi:N-acetylmuramoyl-L-alanine amidase